MFFEQFFDIILNFGDLWKIIQVRLNIKTEELDETVRLYR